MFSVRVQYEEEAKKEFNSEIQLIVAPNSYYDHLISIPVLRGPTERENRKGRDTMSGNSKTRRIAVYLGLLCS